LDNAEGAADGAADAAMESAARDERRSRREASGLQAILRAQAAEAAGVAADAAAAAAASAGGAGGACGRKGEARGGAGVENDDEDEDGGEVKGGDGALQDRVVLLASFSNWMKMDPSTVGVWASVMRRTPHTALWLQECVAKK
jgi:hypothetical protein